MNYWLMKSEPDVYSIEDLARDGSTHWEGVRNYSARNNMRKMARGDLVLFYHSNAKPPGVVGIARVVKTAYSDPDQWNQRSKYYDPNSTKDNPRWSMVDVDFVEQFPQLVPLDRIKQTKGLEDMVLVRRSRLSVQPVTPEQFTIVRRLGTA